MEIWRAFYNDGSHVDQYGWRGKKSYLDIDRSKLTAFAVINVDYVQDFDLPVVCLTSKGEYLKRYWEIPKEKLRYRLHLEKGQRLIYRKLGIKRVNMQQNLDLGTERVWLIGWQENINGKNVQSISYLKEDGSTEQTGKFIAGQPNILPQEIEIG